jgi:hypothetical protein
MDEQEAGYLRQQLQELQRSNHRWKAVALLALSVLAVLVLAGGGSILTGGLLLSQRARQESMRALEAELQAEVAREAEMEARKRAEEAVRQFQEAAKPANPGKQ